MTQEGRENLPQADSPRKFEIFEKFRNLFSRTKKTENPTSNMPKKPSDIPDPLGQTDLQQAPKLDSQASAPIVPTTGEDKAV